jgi:hypothetical protein
MNEQGAVQSRWLPWLLLAVLGVVVIAGSAWWINRRAPQPPPVAAKKVMAPGAPNIDVSLFPDLQLKEVSAELGIDFVHENGAVGDLFMPEPVGSGGGFFDYDNDGDPDLLLLSCCQIADHRDPPAQGRSIVLYENDGKGHFTDVTAGSGLEIGCYAMGLAMADYDNDGWRDIFVTALGHNRLFHCVGKGKYEEVTRQAGVAGSEKQWSSSAGFFDFDNDGDLDLFVCNYAQWTMERDLEVRQDYLELNTYMAPRFFDGSSCQLYENKGEGLFTDVSEQAGMMIRDQKTGKLVAQALGVLFVDLDRDGWQDIVVANDQSRSFLLHNNQDGTFRDAGGETGFGWDSNGKIVAGMGLDICQIEGTPSMLIAIANLAKFHTAMYISQNRPFLFVDEARRTGVVTETNRVTTFGLCFLDYDLDGHLDMFQANGHVNSLEGSISERIEYLQPSQMFWYHGGDGTMFQPVPADKCGTDIYEPILGRAAAFADIDADGDLDMLVTANNERIRLFRNEMTLPHNYLRVELRGQGMNRDAIGAELLLEMDEGSQHRWVMPTRSYLSQVELPITFGLGTDRRPVKLTITWPGGMKQEVSDLPVNRHFLIEQATAPQSASR